MTPHNVQDFQALIDKSHEKQYAQSMRILETFVCNEQLKRGMEGDAAKDNKGQRVETVATASPSAPFKAIHGNDNKGTANHGHSLNGRIFTYIGGDPTVEGSLKKRKLSSPAQQGSVTTQSTGQYTALHYGQQTVAPVPAGSIHLQAPQILTWGEGSVVLTTAQLGLLQENLLKMKAAYSKTFDIAVEGSQNLEWPEAGEKQDAVSDAEDDFLLGLLVVNNILGTSGGDDQSGDNQSGEEE